jgi:hypothetical protein
VKMVFAVLGVGGVLALAVGLLFVGGEVRDVVRSACSDPAAGWLTRKACGALNVRTELPPGVAVQLEDADDVADAEVQTIPKCETGGGLEELIYQAKDLAELERQLHRDFDGNGRIGTVGRRAPAPAASSTAPAGGGGEDQAVEVPPGFLDSADQPEPPEGAEAARGRAIFARKKFGAAPYGGTATASADRQGGPVDLDMVADPAPRKEWLHVLRASLDFDLPVNDHAFGERWRLQGTYMFGRYRPVRVGFGPYFEDLGSDTDWGVVGHLEIECSKGLGGCDPSRP